MRRTSLLQFVCAVGTLMVASVASAPAAETPQARVQAAVDKVFDPSVLHRIEIVVAAVDEPKIIARTQDRIRCTFTFDGVVLRDVGIRQAGGIYFPYVALNGKPALSVKFDEFVEGQELHGLEKMILKNGRQDFSMVNEHLTYEVYRRAGIAAPMTAYAQVTINGADAGIYIMREAINTQFLTRNFGKENSKGNLYELVYQPDPVLVPNGVELKDEKEDGRTRDELLGLAAAFQVAPDDFFVPAVSQYLDFDRYLTFFAVETATSNYDAFSFNTNNTYLYTHPRDGRLILIPNGADQSFWATAPITKLRSLFQTPKSALARKIHSIPAVSERFQKEVARVGQAPIWDKKVLHDRVAQVERIFATAPTTGRSAADVAKLASYRTVIEAFINAGGTTNGIDRLP